MMYKVTNNLVALPVEEFLTPVTRNTRHSNHSKCYLRPHPRTDCYKASFFPRTIPEWNALDPSIAEADTLPQFKARLAATVGCQM